ncbi:2OG-Fe(II) oxygenase [Niveibacterium sp. SC-1]|uniref:2OG-Fe(II) oxygenase family protein n=1 Tax=Niveibacterium sp. SC-1 TaxID=3135646 RepID=UPI00311F04BD
MANGNRLSILSNAARSDLVLDPYPHLLIENALDPQVFAQLAAHFPEDDIVRDGRPEAERWFDYPACKVLHDTAIAPIWQDFFRYHTSEAFFRELVALAGDALRRLNPDLEARIGRPLEGFRVGMRPGGREDTLAPGADVSMECQFYVNYTRQLRAVRGPHVDRPSELFAALLYFRDPADESEGGDLEICEAQAPLYPDSHSVKIAELPAEIAPAAVRTIKSARYRANTLVLFLNSPRSVHAVSPRTPSPLTRRHINFCCDVPFDLFSYRLPPKLALKNRLNQMPMGWRIAKYI